VNNSSESFLEHYCDPLEPVTNGQIVISTDRAMGDRHMLNTTLDYQCDYAHVPDWNRTDDQQFCGFLPGNPHALWLPEYYNPRACDSKCISLCKYMLCTYMAD